MSDHFSGPRALAGPAGDICDFYAFPSPERAGHLVLVMSVMPLAGPESFFSDAIVCRFRLRPLAIDRQQIIDIPFLAACLGHDLLDQHIQRRFRNSHFVEFALADGSN